MAHEQTDADLEKLLHRASAGDDEALKTLLAACCGTDTLRRAARDYGIDFPDQSGADGLQEAFARAYEHARNHKIFEAGKFVSTIAVKCWMIRIMNYFFIDQARKLKRLKPLPVHQEGSIAGAPVSFPDPKQVTPSKDAAAAEDATIVLQARQQLEEDEQNLLDLRAEGLKFPEIAMEMEYVDDDGKPDEDKARYRFELAVKHLRAHYRNLGGKS